jgi:hypothetical protein
LVDGELRVSVSGAEYAWISNDSTFSRAWLLLKADYLNEGDVLSAPWLRMAMRDRQGDTANGHGLASNQSPNMKAPSVGL